MKITPHLQPSLPSLPPWRRCRAPTPRTLFGAAPITRGRNPAHGWVPSSRPPRTSPCLTATTPAFLRQTWAMGLEPSAGSSSKQAPAPTRSPTAAHQDA
ncbi:hypothetical protein IMCC26134_12400 [Verrucomicrobia bacterium IMCC26134]|nr:hypothetical protein IMCC26134_12400 [Verrucomicrobia bacterium IMCC26134]